jgi:hypothetical protein
MSRIASSPYLTQLLAVSATCGLCAVYAVATRATSPLGDARIPVPMIPQASTVERLERPVVATVKQPAPPPEASSQLLFVFQAGGDTYVKLSDDTPRHGKRRLVEGDGGVTTIAEVEASKLPRALRGWETKQVTLDGGCTVAVTGFAVVTRLVGDPGYAGRDEAKWTVTSAASTGSSALAARIAAPAECKDALYARDAALAPIVTLEKIENEKLATTATSALLAGDSARAAQASWDEHASGDAETAKGSWADHASFDTRVLRHPVTGTTWVAIHATATEQGCGGPQINVFGLYRVNDKGELVTVEDRALDTVWSIDRILDLDNNGTLELLGKDWLGLETVLVQQTGEELSRLAMPFYGCPC